MVNKYFEKLEKVISGFQEIIANQTIRKKTYNDTQGLILGEIDFTNESQLSFMELKNTKLHKKKKYKYLHFTNISNFCDILKKESENDGCRTKNKKCFF